MTESSFKGTTWGKVDFSETALKFNTTDERSKEIFNVEFQSINNATVNKNDIIIETGAEIQNEQDYICQIRFHVQAPKEQNDEQNSQSDSQNKEGEDNSGKDKKEKQKRSHAEEIYKKILQKAKIGSFGGQSIITLNEVNLNVPRGKYTIDFYQKNFRFHGQTYNFIIPYKNITKGFMLPMENQSQVSIILQLHKDRPIYQGQTLYRYIVIHLKKDIETETKSRVKDKDKEKFPHLSQLKEQYEGPLFQVFIDVIRTIAQVVLIAPDPKDFKSRGGQSCVKCGVKTQTGWLYFLKKSLIFIMKPVLYFKTEDILKVEFHRLGANNKQFDLKVMLNIEKAKPIQFTGIERSELDNMIEYFKSKNVSVEKEEDVKKVQPALAELDDDESDDDDFNADEEDSDDDQSDSDEEQSQSKPKKPKKSTDNKEARVSNQNMRKQQKEQ